jgi:hypothetical protein
MMQKCIVVNCKNALPPQGRVRRISLVRPVSYENPESFWAESGLSPPPFYRLQRFVCRCYFGTGDHFNDA